MLVLKIRLEREILWISTLQTVYPYGLNIRVKEIGDFNPIFHSGPRKRKKKHRSRKPKRLRTKSDFSIDFVI